MEWAEFVQALRRAFPPPETPPPFVQDNVPNREDFPLEDALYFVTIHDHLTAFELIVDYFHINLETTTVREFRSVLHLSCAVGGLGITCSCLDRGVPLELLDNEGQTPLMRTMFSTEGGFLCAQILLEAGANPNARNAAGWSILHCAVFHGSCSPQTLVHLLEKGASPNATDAHGRTALHLAVLSSRSNVAEMVRILLQNGVDVNAQTDTGRTALALCRDEAIALLLLEAGARPDIQNRSGETPLHFACLKWKAAPDDVFNAMMNLMYNPANVNPTNANLPDAEGRTPLHWVCSTEKNKRYVEPLILFGANPDAPDNQGRSPLHYAALIPAISFGLTTLLNSERRLPDEIDPADVDIDLTVALIIALLRLGATNSFQDFDGQSALHYAVLTGSIEIVRCLLEHGCPVGQQDFLGRTPLHLFGFRIGPNALSLWNGAETATFLHQRGHDEGRLRLTRDPQYEEPAFPYCAIEGELFEASRREEVVELLRILLHAGAPVYVADFAGNFPFFVSAAARWFDPVFMLIREAAAQGLFQG